MAILVINSEVLGRIFVGDREYQAGERLVSPKNGSLDIILVPRYTEPTYLSVCVTLLFREDRLIPSKGYRATLFGEYVEITLTPPVYRPSHAPTVISQLTLGTSLATLYDDGELRVMCEGDRFITRTLPPLKKPRLSLRETDEGNILVVSGETDLSDYLLVVTVSDGKTLYEITAHSLSITEDCVVATEHISDMMGHIVTTTYRTGLPPSVEVTSTHSPTLTDELMPYALLEALRVDARDEVMRYLAIDTDYDSVKEYFGTFDTVRPLPGKDFDPHLVAVYDSSLPFAVPEVYCFDVHGGKIQNVDKREGFYPKSSLYI